MSPFQLIMIKFSNLSPYYYFLGSISSFFSQDLERGETIIMIIEIVTTRRYFQERLLH